MRGGSRTLAAPAEQVERWIVPGMSASAESPNSCSAFQPSRKPREAVARPLSVVAPLHKAA